MGSVFYVGGNSEFCEGVRTFLLKTGEINGTSGRSERVMGPLVRVRGVGC